MNDLTTPATAGTSPAYEEDALAWLEHQAGLLRARRFDQLDIGNLLEQLESIVRHERNELKSRLEVLLLHLLKCQFQPERKTRSWVSTVDEQRARIADLLEESPSLEGSLVQYLERAFARAARRAAIETGLPLAVYPAACPYTPAQLLDDTFLP